MDDWKRELFWCLIGSVMGTALSEMVGALKERTSRRRGKHFRRSR